MPGKSLLAYGNESLDSLLYLSSVTFPTLAANASADTTVTVPGVQPLDCLSWNIQSPPSHLVVDNMFVSALNTITIRWGTDATGITGATVALLIEVVRADGANLGTQALPAALV